MIVTRGTISLKISREMVDLRLPGLPDDLSEMRYREMAQTRKTVCRQLYNITPWLERWPSLDEQQELRKQFREYVESVSRYVGQMVDQLPFVVNVAHAFTQRETATYGGSDHLVVVGEEVVIGRFSRMKGDALCKPAAKFWGLSIVENRLPDCVACIERAELIVGGTLKRF